MAVAGSISNDPIVDSLDGVSMAGVKDGDNVQVPSDLFTTLITAIGDQTLAFIAEATEAIATKVNVSDIGVSVQAFSTNLQSFSSLVGQADRIAYFTGAGALALTPLTSFGRSLIGDASASAARTTLGLGTAATTASSSYATAAQGTKADSAIQPGDTKLVPAGGTTGQVLTKGSAADHDTAWVSVGGGSGIGDMLKSDNLSGLTNYATARSNLGLAIGSNVQAYDADLAAIAALTTAANKVPYFTGSGTAALADFTAAGRALMDDADAAAQRTTLGLGTAAVANLLDEDNFASNSATAVPSQQSTKAYVDSAVAAAAAASFNTQSAAAAATITSSTDFISVEGKVYQRITASHPRLGPEIVTNGSMSTTDAWVPGLGWSVSSGVANKTAEASASNMYQDTTSGFVVGAAYFYSYNIISISGGHFRTLLSDMMSGPFETTAGSKSGVVVVTSVGNTFFYLNAIGPTAVTLDNVSLKRLPADAFQSADGAWWAQPFVGARELDFVSMFGAVADGADTLDPGAKTTVRGDWVTATSYAVNDLVWTGTPKLGYRCLTAHTSGTFATDLAAGKWVLGAFSGTDNTAAFNRMVLAHEASGIPMRVPYGKYRVLNPSTTADSAYVTVSGQVFDLALDGMLLIDEDGTAGKNYNLFKSTNFSSPSSDNERQMFRITGRGGVRGRWSHKPGGNTPNARAHVLAIAGYANIHLEGWFFEDIAGSFSRATDLGGVYCNNMRGERVAKGGLRFLKTNDARVTNNKLRHFGDDVIDIHAAGNKIRSRTYIAGNQTFDAETIIALGARETSVIGNQSAMSKSGAIFIGGRVSAEGDNAAMMIVVTGNTVTDPLMTSADGSTLANNDGTQGAIVVGSVPASWRAGDYNGSSVNDPLSAAYYYNIDLDTTNVPRGGSIEVYGNPTRHTRPDATKFSDYGEGLCFHQDGWIDPAVTFAKRVPNGVALLSDIENFRVDVNVAGFRSGAGVLFRFLPTTEVARNFSFRNGRVSGTVTDCLDGVSHSFWNGSAQNINFPVHFSDFHCDLDPYHVSAARSSATGGNWNNSATEAQKNYGLRLFSMRGFTVENCSFKNLWAPVYGDTSKNNGIYRGNVLYGVRAASGFSASNYGIGDMVWSNDQFDLIEVTSIPSAGSGTYDVFSRVAAREGTVSLADDTATSITPPRPNGLMSIVSNANSMVALFAYDVTSGVINAVGTSGSSTTLGTAALAGTTGTDARVNYASVNDGKIYIENRIGSTRVFRWKFIDG